MTNLTYAVGDIHGDFDLTLKLLDKIYEHSKRQPDGLRSIVFLGDYIDRGPQSFEVVNHIFNLDTLDDRFADFNLTFIRGNHEDFVIKSYVDEDEGFFDSWLRNGGIDTINSLECNNVSIRDFAVMLINNTTHFTMDNYRAYVHASMCHNRSSRDQIRSTNLWAGYKKTDDLPYVTEYNRELHVVHGHIPQKSGTPLCLTNRTNLDTGSFFTGVLTAGVFDDDKEGGPIEILNVRKLPPNEFE